jgi:phosphatidylserine/phosphatidylglycerophosphate/cardiolipin synthase-like enzyme
MVDSKAFQKPSNVERFQEEIAKVVGADDDLSATPMDLRALSQKLCKVPDREHREVPAWMMDTLFEQAAEKMKDDHDKKVVENLRKLVSQVEEDMYRPKPRYMDAFFFPNKKNVNNIVKYIGMAKKTLYICVFNITNDDLAKAIISRHKAGVDVRIISDDECASNKGSDIQKLADEGIEVRTDSEPSYHMHDKFMVVDNKFVLTGSFNWTFQAGSHNQENVLVVDHPYYCEKYSSEFDNLWHQFNKNEVEGKQHKAATTIQKKARSNNASKNAKSYAKHEPQQAPVKAKSTY